MKELDWDYDISVNNMLDFDSNETYEGFDVDEARFATTNMNIIRKILTNNEGKQIFKMKDGKFILEVEIAGDVEYFYSNELNDLLKN